MLFLFSVCLQSHGGGGRHHGAACAEDGRDGSCDHERLVGVDDPHWTPPVSGELSGALRAETGQFVQGDIAFYASLLRFCGLRAEGSESTHSSRVSWAPCR